MKKQKNTAFLWDSLWRETKYRKGDLWGIEKEQSGIRWQRIERTIIKEYGDFRGLKVVEIGAGAGKNSALFAKKGAQVTLIDYSESALNRARNLFKQLHVSAQFLKQDAFQLPSELNGQFDISMSFGLAEHFQNEKRFQVNKIHFDLIKDGGLTLISVPNKYNPPYRIYKSISEMVGTWRYGQEHPYSRKEYVEICRSLSIKKFTFFGDSFWASFRFLNPFGSLRKALGLKPWRERGSPFDSYFSYSLILRAKK